MTDFPQKILAVINAVDESAKGALLPEPPAEGETWEVPECPPLPGRQGLDRVSKPRRRRKGLQHEAARLSFLHAIWHIEISAIDLACLCCLRGSGMPQAFHQEFLTVAAEEVQHATMIRDLLSQRGYPPGSEPVHDSLWHTAMTAQDLGEQLVLVPRVLEARGLDANAELLPRMREVDSAAADVLQRIYDDEIGHVSHGITWHRLWCQGKGLDPQTHLQETIALRMSGESPLIGPMDRNGRLRAGFNESELDWLDAQRRTPRAP